MLESSRRDKVYNPAPLSIPHARLEGNCAACHDPAARDAMRSIQGGRPPGNVMAMHVFGSSALINQACQKCHADMDLHQPTSETLALKDFHSELHIVAANGCSPATRNTWADRSEAAGGCGVCGLP